MRFTQIVLLLRLALISQLIVLSSSGLIPPAILANAYKGALEHGKTRDKWVLVVFNFRGERPGKTSLVRSLRGESFNKDEARTAGIQMDSPLLRVGIQPWKPVPQSVKYTVFDRKIFQLVARRLLGGFHELERSPTKITPYDVLKACPAEKKGQTTGVEGSGYNVDLELLHSQTGGIRSPQGSPPSQCREGRY